MIERAKTAPRSGQVRRVYLLALLLVLSLFFFHTFLLFEVAELFMHSQTLIGEHIGQHRVGRTIILGCFFVLLIAHVSEAAAYGLFLRWNRLVPTFSEALYFAAATITALGYGDVVLPPPWRQLGPLVAIAGLLTFGCSTAFLFVVMHSVWQIEL
ncbi:MAG: potassium channel family protein [Chromatiaceae bacterium]|jgi:hypothetical protein|nr:potassium channel family protein [Chromatiaceae bacterium]